ncbi:hypothetical protein WSM22_02970 [Cytophagales bacterium WSM2-2]|nr:hypothetical protein WSM22_02970 [Cytophagales bacterium WSM2-2]
MKGYELNPDVRDIGSQANSGEISLDSSYVVGVSVECLNSSVDNLQFSIKGNINITLEPGDPAREFGGFEICGVPGYYSGILKWSFASSGGAGQTRGRIILTTVGKSGKEI